MGAILKLVPGAIFGAALVVGLLAGPAAAQAVRVDEIRAHLFYNRSGTLSDDILKTKPALFNITVGAGDGLKETAESVLIVIALKGPPSGFDQSETITVTITDEKAKKKVVERKFNGFLFDDKGRLVKPIFLENKVCAPLRVVAKGRGGEKAVTIPFMCGE
jgi:hypothetical protein